MAKVLPADTNFVVTGLARSGTTYMMRCLEAGGMPIAHRSWRYELTKQDFGINLKKYEGRCFKHFTYRLMNYNPSKLAVICMKRDPYKMVVSCIRFGSKIHPWAANWKLIHDEKLAPRGWKLDVSAYEANMQRCATYWKKHSRAYIACNIENMNDRRKRRKFFTALKNQGWPIDVEKAMNVENDEKQRVEEKGRKVQWT